MTTALVLTDIQNDYFPGGAMALVGMGASAARAAVALAHFRDRRALSVHVQRLSVRPGATFFLPGTDGAAHHTSVAPRPGETVVRKHFPNTFRDRGLDEVLRAVGADTLLIAGAMSHRCIDATTRAACDLGCACRVAEDACAMRDLAFHGDTVPAAQINAAFMAVLAAPYAQAAPTAELLRA